MPRKRRNKANKPLKEVNQTSQAPRDTVFAGSESSDIDGIKNEFTDHRVAATENDENSLPTITTNELEPSTDDLHIELDSFRQRWRRELEVAKPPDDNPIKDTSRVDSIQKKNESNNMGFSADQINNSTADLYNELDSFRQRWRREAGTTKSKVQPSCRTYDEAKQLFLRAVELEQDDMHHESIRFYKMAMHICPDIEKQIFREQCEASVAAATATAVSSANMATQPQSTSQEDRSYDDAEKQSLFKRIHQNFYDDMQNEQRQGYYRPKNKIKPGVLHISDLPHELVLVILRYVVGEELDLASLESLGLVCRGFYLLSHDSSLWKSICYHTWAEEATIYANQRRWISDGRIDWKQMFLDQPRVNYDGVYISRTRYIRQGDVDFQDLTYRPFHVIRYYRYLRFFPDKRVLILTTNEEPDKIIPIFRHALHSKQFSPELSILEGSFEFSSDSQINITAEKDCRASLNLTQNQRRKAQLDWYRQTPISQKFNLKFQLKTVETKPFKNNALKWLDYTMLTRRETGQEITTFDLSPDTFPNLFFVRVKKFNLRLTNPLCSR